MKEGWEFPESGHREGGGGGGGGRSDDDSPPFQKVGGDSTIRVSMGY